MAVEIKRMDCAQIPGVVFLSFETTQTENDVLVHMHQFVGLSLGKTDRKTCAKAARAFLECEIGRGLKNGGDLRAAIQKGQLVEQLYTHRMRADGGGSASLFVTLEGVKKILQGLPNQDEATKQRHQDLFSSFLNPSGTQCLKLDVATPEQCARYDTEDVIEEIFTEGCAPVQGNDSTIVVTQKMWFDTKLCSCESIADKRVLEAQLQTKDAQLQAKDTQITAISLVKAAEISKERTEKEMAQNELVNVRKTAEKDIQIVKLQMKLELAEEMAKFRSEGRLERGEDQDKVQRVVPGPVLKKMHERDTLFSRLVSSAWNNDILSVNSFVKLSPTNSEPAVAFVSAMPRLKIEFSTGISQADRNLISDLKHRPFGFCYKGPAIAETVFRQSTHIKEAYGVETDGVQYVVVVVFKKSGFQISDSAALPYELGLLPWSITAEIIPGCNHHISVYKISVSTDDFALEMVKCPSMNKWYWHSAGKDN